MKKNGITVFTMGFYGNRVITEVDADKIDAFLLGYINTSLFDPNHDRIDRAIVRVPGADNLVVIYNKNDDAKYIERGFKCLVNIPELNISIHSRCIFCRMNDTGAPESYIGSEDFNKIEKYLMA